MATTTFNPVDPPAKTNPGASTRRPRSSAISRSTGARPRRTSDDPHWSAGRLPGSQAGVQTPSFMQSNRSGVTEPSTLGSTRTSAAQASTAHLLLSENVSGNTAANLSPGRAETYGPRGGASQCFRSRVASWGWPTTTSSVAGRRLRRARDPHPPVHGGPVPFLIWFKDVRPPIAHTL